MSCEKYSNIILSKVLPPSSPPRVNSPCHCSCHSSCRAVDGNRSVPFLTDTQTYFEKIMVYLRGPMVLSLVICGGFLYPERRQTDGCGCLWSAPRWAPGRDTARRSGSGAGVPAPDSSGSLRAGCGTLPVCEQPPVSRSGAAQRALLPRRAGPGGPRLPAGAAASAWPPPAGGPSPGPGPARPRPPLLAAGQGHKRRDRPPPVGLGGSGPCAGRPPAGPGRGSRRWGSAGPARRRWRPERWRKACPAWPQPATPRRSPPSARVKYRAARAGRARSVIPPSALRSALPVPEARRARLSALG